MRTLVDYYRMMDTEDVRDLLMDLVDDSLSRKEIRTAPLGDIDNLFFSELVKLSKCSVSPENQNEVLRACAELLMKKLRVAFTKNLDDEALFRLFRRYVSEKVINHMKPALYAGYLMARSDDDYHEDEQRMLTFFIKNLDVSEEVKAELLATFYQDADALFDKMQSTTVKKALGSLFAPLDHAGKEQVLRFAYSLAIADGQVQKCESIFYENIARVMDVDPAQVIEVREAVEQEHRRYDEHMELGKILDCQHYNDMIVFSKVNGYSAQWVLAGAFVLGGLAGMAVAGGALMLKKKRNYGKLNVVFTTLALLANGETKEASISGARNVFEKLASETKEMVSLCSDIHLYLKNMNKSYAEVSEQAWLKGVWGQLSAMNRKQTLSGDALLSVVATDVGELLLKIVEHQKALPAAIDEHFRLIALSEDLQSVVKELLLQNKHLVSVVAEAESVGVMESVA